MNNTLSNGLRVVELLSEREEPFSVKDVAIALKLPNSHACRLLKTLVESGYVEQESKGRRYKISLKALRLANNCLCRLGIRGRLRPFLVRLCRSMEAAIYLSVPYQGLPLIIDIAYPGGRHIDAGISIGSVNPIHASASGKICAAWHSEDSLDDFLAAQAFPRLTDNTITGIEQFKKELADIRKAGVAVANGERAAGVGAIAAPVFNCDGDFIAILGAAFDSGRFSEDDWEKNKDTVREAAEAASFALGYARAGLV
ncbi:MAG: IclR family transcriptional regulator [Planctomycetota bacterium]